MLYWLFFGSSALIGVYTLAGGTKLIQDFDDRRCRSARSAS